MDFRLPTASRTVVSSAMSQRRAATGRPVARAMRWAVATTPSSSAMIVTSPPAAAKLWAIASPMPRLAPVTRIFLPLKSNSVTSGLLAPIARDREGDRARGDGRDQDQRAQGIDAGIERRAQHPPDQGRQGHAVADGE